MRIAALLLAGVVLPFTVAAQTVGHGNNYQDPTAPNYKAPVVPATPPEPTYHLPPLPQSEPAGAGTGGQMFIKHIEVRGVTVFKPERIRALVAPYENRSVTGAELQTLRVTLTRLYVDQGYIDSGVILPTQESKDGIVLFQAVEGRLTRIEVSGPAHIRPSYVAGRMRRQVGTPLNLASLQSGLRYLQQDPNVARLDAALAPGDALGESVLRLNVEEQPRFSIGAGFNNHQSSSIGPNLASVMFSARDVTGFGEEFRGSVGHSDGDTLGSAVLTVPVTARNATVQAYFSRADAAIIQQPFQALNIKETTRTYGLSLTLPLVDRLTQRLAFFLGAESNRAYTELLGIPFSFSPGAQNGVEQVTALLGGFDWMHRGPNTVTDLRLTYRRGIDALGATIYEAAAKPSPFNPNPTGADGRFGLEQLQFIHIARLNGLHLLASLNDRAQVVVRASGQYSQEPLLSVEKYTVGGVNTVRGFPENLLVRDNGASATLELQLPVPGYRARPYWGDLVIAPFVDYGRSWDKVNVSQGNRLIDTTRPNYIASAGIGLLWNPLPGADLQVYWGRGIANNFGANDPLRFAPHDLQYHGVHFSVTYLYRW